MLRQHDKGVVAEYPFYEKRKWKCDYYLPSFKLCIEIEGGCFVQGRHTRGAGFVGDMAKYNSIVILGLTLLRYQPNEIEKCNIDIGWITEFDIVYALPSHYALTPKKLKQRG